MTIPVHPELLAHNQQFKKQVIELTHGTVYTAVGFAASNVHMIVGEISIIIVDTTESTKAAENILAEFRKITKKPIEKIIYTHSHRDHISGATVFSATDDVEILAHACFKSDLIGLDTSRPAPHTAMAERTKKQFGIDLSFPDERVNLGCGPGDRPMEGLGQGFVSPATLVSARHSTIAFDGPKLELIHAPGETPDHLMVWLPQHKVLICGDNYYHSFPNLYAIRGTPYRDFNAWADSLDLMLDLQAEVISPGHTLPVQGAAEVREVLTDYRDAIRYIISATAEGMNAGLSIDEMAARITLPSGLAIKPHLQEFYGQVSWSVRAYCVGTLGWFDGNPSQLNALSPKEEAQRFIELAGGIDAVLKRAEESVAEDPQWVLELTDRLIALDELSDFGRELRIAALELAASNTKNATARNFYLSSVKILKQFG